MILLEPTVLFVERTQAKHPSSCLLDPRRKTRGLRAARRRRRRVPRSSRHLPLRTLRRRERSILDRRMKAGAFLIKAPAGRGVRARKRRAAESFILRAFLAESTPRRRTTRDRKSRITSGTRDPFYIFVSYIRVKRRAFDSVSLLPTIVANWRLAKDESGVRFTEIESLFRDDP